MDQNIGKLMAALNSEGLTENTVVMFMSDNGGCSANFNKTPDARIGTRDSNSAYGKWYNVSNTPYRMSKSREHEGGIITPLIMHWPTGIKQPGQIVDEPIHVMDIMPACLELAAGTYPATYKSRMLDPLDGISFLPLLTGAKQDPERVFYWEHEGNRAVRKGDWKLVALNKKPWELYNLAKDPYEQNNLSGQNPQKAAELLGLYKKWAAMHGVKPWPLKKSFKK
jgi:arylsulfatase